MVPSQKQAAKNKTEDPFAKSHFTYDPENDWYLCPAGQRLCYSYTNTGKKARVYRGGSFCRTCRHWGVCTKQPRGRGITRLLKVEQQQRLEEQYARPQGQAIYALRKQKVELPFVHIKRNLKVDSFLMRGLAGVKAEASLWGSCFNVARMITLLGVAGLIARLAS